MFKTLLLKNFKSFEGVHQIPLAPLTLIFGKNSAGKSSIIQSILFLKQSEKALWNGEPAIWKGDDVDLGSMEHALFGQGRRPGYDEISVGLVGASRNDVNITEFDWNFLDWSRSLISLEDKVSNKKRSGFDPVRFTWPKSSGNVDGGVGGARLARWELLDERTLDPLVWSVTGQTAPERTTKPFAIQFRSAHQVFGNTYAQLNHEHSHYRKAYDDVESTITQEYLLNIECWSRLLKESIRHVRDISVLSDYLNNDIYDGRDFLWLTSVWERTPLRELVALMLRSQHPRASLGGTFDEKFWGHGEITSSLSDENVRHLFNEFESLSNRHKISGAMTLWYGRVGQRFLTYVIASIRKLRGAQKKSVIAKCHEFLKKERIYHNNNEYRELMSLILKGTEPNQQISIRVLEELKSTKNAKLLVLYNYLREFGEWVNNDLVSSVEDEEAMRVDSLQKIDDALQRLSEQYSNRNITFREFLADHAMCWSSRATLDMQMRLEKIGHQDLDGGWRIAREFFEKIFEETLDRDGAAIPYLPLLEDGEIWKIDDIVHIKGVRNQLQRSYEGLQDARSAPSAIPGSSFDLVNRLTSNPQVRKILNNNLIKLGMKYEFEISTISNPVFPISYQSFVIRDSRNGVAVGAQDVGYGVGQVIPVLVALSDLNNEVLLLEQPELHLHPAMQAMLGEMLVDAVLASSGQIIAETHSEHVILRVLRLIREKKISHEMVQVLYIDQDEEGKSRHINLPIDEYGEFTEDWPNGFFDERLAEL